ncbi:ankyrin repeat-containing domain protein [Dunaliella salina]|uniref:Ankyrin repeat-containing domain protein n=1 Tax=Dunaliella salina TaxID=3046 RepID=A0ABZ3KIP1_DUNSA|nr:ankyrin repeat-containing domain protein [Dunaliella salina]|eukprot:KAF5829039.1 ankyrin repeat-containing domain protein [Dunaliella salina]
MHLWQCSRLTAMSYSASRTQDGCTPLLAAALGSHESVAMLLLDRCFTLTWAGIDRPNEVGCTPLFAASSLGLKDVAQALLDRGARVDKVSLMGGSSWTPLGAACKNGHQEVASLLLQHGAKANAVPKGSDARKLADNLLAGMQQAAPKRPTHSAFKSFDETQSLDSSNTDLGSQETTISGTEGRNWIDTVRHAWAVER